MSHHHLPALTQDNFGDWEMAIISYLMNTADHICVIKQHPDDKDMLTDLKRPTVAADTKEWDTSKHEALGVIMSTASKLHCELILKHCADRKPVYKLWTKICSLHQSCNSSLHHQAYLEFFMMHKMPDESYSAYVAHKEDLYARISCLMPAGQSDVNRRAELTLTTILFGLPYDNHICQTLTTQPTSAISIFA